jgi:hypothetical protein
MFGGGGGGSGASSRRRIGWKEKDNMHTICLLCEVMMIIT